MGVNTSRVWVTVPTLDEVENIAQLIQGVRASVPDAHILVVDDGSADGTADKAEALGAELGGIEVLRRPHKMGLGSAYRAGHAIGIAAATTSWSRSTPTFRTIRPRCPNCSPQSTAAPTSRSDRVTFPAARFRTGRSDACCSRCGATATRDSCSGYACTTPPPDTARTARSILRAMDIESTHSTGYAFQIEMTYRAMHAGGQIEEVPISFTDRVRGTSKMSGHIVGEAMTLVTMWGLRDRVFGKLKPRRSPAPDLQGARR